MSFGIRRQFCLPHAVCCARLLLVVTVALFGGAVSTRAAFAAAFQRGDVFLTGAGQVQEYTPGGKLVQVVPSSVGATDLCFDPSGDHLIAPGVGLFDSAGNQLPSNWVSVTNSVRCVADGLGNVYLDRDIPNPTVPRDSSVIQKFDLNGNLLQTFSVANPTGLDAIDLAPDECSLYYGSWGVAPTGPTWRVPLKFNVCTSTQEPAPAWAYPFVDDLRVLPNSQVLVLDDPRWILFDPSGSTVRSGPYVLNPELRSLSLDPDGTSVWAAGGGVYRWDINNGRLLSSWPGGGGIAVYGPPLLGDANVASTVASDAPGSAQAFQTQAGYSGHMSALRLFVDSSSTANQAVVGVYSDRNGRPGFLQDQATITNVTAGSWNYVRVPPMPVTAGERNWIAVLAPDGGGTISFRDAAGGGRSDTNRLHNLTALPAHWEDGKNSHSGPLSAYGS